MLCLTVPKVRIPRMEIVALVGWRPSLTSVRGDRFAEVVVRSPECVALTSSDVAGWFSCDAGTSAEESKPHASVPITSTDVLDAG